MTELTMKEYMANIVRAQHGEPAEIPSRPGDLRVPTQSIAAVIATLAQQVTQAAELLEEARVRHRTAAEHRVKCEAMFAKAREELLRAMDEHGEGRPDGDVAADRPAVNRAWQIGD